MTDSPLVGQIDFRQANATRMTTTKSYDKLNRLTQMASLNSAYTPPGPPGARFTYQYNNANQRTRRMEADASYWVYQYDALGQVTSGKKYWSDGTPVPGQQFEYTHDDIGNRTATKAGGDSGGGSLRSASYTANTLNQYTSRDVPNAFDVLGAAYATTSVTVNGAATDYRRTEYFQKLLTVVNSATSVWQTVSVTNSGGGSSTGQVFVAKTAESFTYDADGNLTQDGRWTLSWDAENRLVNLTSLSSTPSSSRLKLDFTYDPKGRRIQKAVSTWNGSSYVAQSTNRFVYDGWNLIAILDSQSSLLQSFVWGMDLSGSLQGAGGVGGLLMLNSVTNGVHFYAMDGNGNVTALVKASDGTVSANYEYDPFGQTIRATGLLAKENHFRFSTKYQDDESDLLYYGHRYLKTSAGGWLSRDTINENGGENLYRLVGNNAINATDSLGLKQYNLTDDVRVFPGHTPTAVTYPRRGPFACCRGRKIGEVTPLGVIVDADATESLKQENGGLFDEINSNFPLTKTARSALSLPGYVGGGPYLKFDKTWEGKICCPNSSWKQTIVSTGEDDGTFNNSYFFDMAGYLPKRYPGKSGNQYHLELQCHRGGYTFTVWEMFWSYSATWKVGKPNINVTVTVPW